jgi:hypothetical protein
MVVLRPALNIADFRVLIFLIVKEPLDETREKFSLCAILGSYFCGAVSRACASPIAGRAEGCRSR